ncbi:Predicted dithiol-disulfide isomerase, DsbA family [Actinopolyspora xinjiangensis]|uniref:Predicted dithiol-disulfide isomerase, DsbA family n=1 Tax=Actinopolyspora xinjiangensis TaxID=405564 RepID=A0A1H0V5W3_9ACTN|nr:DsbA family protein [Actinopolyspora xinjiangensis]SDP73817.1 Predicted dithiol-disulfide isomerase, DsbA family [Actinopolyspora xinjiangensis]
MTRVDVYFDYVCPFCLLAEADITTVAEEYGVGVEWHPFELRPAPAETLRPEDDYLPAIWQRAVYPMARRKGVEIKLPSTSPQPYSHTAFEGYQYAREHGIGQAYNEQVLRAFFQRDLDIGRIDVLSDLAAELGLNSDEFEQALTDRRYGETHRKALEHARDELGITAVPTVLIGQHRIEGVPSEERLRTALSSTLDTAS